MNKKPTQKEQKVVKKPHPVLAQILQEKEPDTVSWVKG